MEATSIVTRGDSLMVKLWDRHAPGWRESFANNIIKNPVKNEKLAAEIRLISQSTPLTDDDLDSEPREADSLTIQRFMTKRRGNWWQLPADLMNDDE